MYTNRIIKDGMGGYVVSREDTVKQYKKSGNKWKKELKALKKQDTMIYSIANKPGSRHEIKNINKIQENLLRRVSAIVVILPVKIWTPIPC